MTIQITAAFPSLVSSILADTGLSQIAAMFIDPQIIGTMLLRLDNRKIQIQSRGMARSTAGVKAAGVRNKMARLRETSAIAINIQTQTHGFRTYNY